MQPKGKASISISDGSCTLSDGKNPYCNLVFDANGNLYGTTYGGGSQGFGVVWEITP
jgi:uncharacterized repeat protein (TIGR03803 family)